MKFKSLLNRISVSFKTKPANQSSLNFNPLSLITDGEIDIFKYVKEEAKAGYAEKLNKVTLSTMGIKSDIILSRMETVYFNPEDVTLSNRNWMLDAFADGLDHRNFDSLDNGQKFYIYHLDTGIDKNHPDLKTSVVDEYSFTGEPAVDGEGHGTFSASMYGSTNPDHSPFTKKIQRGEIVIGNVKVLANNGSGDFNKIVDALRFVANDAPDKQKQGYKTFINMSLGADAQTPPELAAVLKMAHDNGVTIFAATGNSGLSQIATPANDPNVIAITAITPQLIRANFANIGKGVSFAEGGVMCYGATLGGGSGFNNGTSFSCPWLINVFVSAYSLYSFETQQDAFDYVKSVAQDLGATGYDTVYGHGYGVMRWILNNPPKGQAEIIVDEPINQVIKRDYSFKTITGFEASWKEKGKDNNDPWETIFIEELDTTYSGFLSPDDAEKYVIRELEKAFSAFKFLVTDDMDYVTAGKFIILFLEEYFKVNDINISFQYALIDNNEDSNIVVELDDETLHGKKQKYYLFNPESWKNK